MTEKAIVAEWAGAAVGVGALKVLAWDARHGRLVAVDDDSFVVSGGRKDGRRDDVRRRGAAERTGLCRAEVGGSRGSTGGGRIRAVGVPV